MDLLITLVELVLGFYIVMAVISLLASLVGGATQGPITGPRTYVSGPYGIIGTLVAIVILIYLLNHLHL